MSFPVACILSFVVHHFLAGNILAAIHGAAHRLCAKASEWKKRSQLLMVYYYGHDAHHVVESIEALTFETKRPFMQTPFSGWVVIAIIIFCVTGVTTLSFFPFVNLWEYGLAWACNMGGALSFFLVYEIAHRRTHQKKSWFISRMHALHHHRLMQGFGMWFSDDIVANYFTVEFATVMGWLKSLEDAAILWVPGVDELLKRMTAEGFSRYEAARRLRTSAHHSVQAGA
jgi:hypothetical protein